MAAPTTPEQWLPVLADKLDKRYKDLEKLRRYARGQADLPEMGKNLRRSWEAFQKKARTDYGGIAVRSLRNRIRPNGIRIGQASDHPALEAVRKIELDNGLTRQILDAIRDYFEVGVGYVAVRRDKDGTVLVRRESPEMFYAYPDPVKPWKALAALKVWRDELDGVDYARVTIENESQTFVRPSTNSNGSKIATAAGGGWQPTGDPDKFTAEASTVIFDRGDDGPFLAPHIDVIDRVNLGKLHRLVISAIQAFRQRGLKPKEGSGGLPDVDEAGNAIDWASAFAPAPGALWELPEGIDIWESQQVDLRPLLDAEQADARDFAAATGTPISVLIPEGQNQSAEGAANAKEQQISQAREDIDRLKRAAALVVVYALDMARADRQGDEVEVLFAPPEHVSLTERYAAAVQAKGAGLSARTIKRDILGMTPDQIAQDEADAGADMLAAALLGVAGNGRQNAQEPAQATQEAVANDTNPGPA